MKNTDLIQGIVLTVIACFVLAGMDSVGKHLVQELNPAQVVWARYTFHTLLVGAVFGLGARGPFLVPRHPWLQFTRGLCLLGVTLGMYFAIRSIPLADATAIMFLAPVLVTLLAGWLLKEPVRPLHWAALVLGLGGVVLIIRPGFDTPQAAMLLPLGSALFLAFYFVITRYLRGRDGETTTLFHTTASGSVLMSIVVIVFWTPPTLAQWGMLAAVGALGAVGHLLLIRAFHLGRASSLSPYLNAQIVAAALYSVWFFDDPLSPAFLTGALLITAAGVLSWQLERKLNARQAD